MEGPEAANTKYINNSDNKIAATCKLAKHKTGSKQTE